MDSIKKRQRMSGNVHDKMDFITIEYSLKQKCFHVDRLSHILELNRRNVLSHNPNDYLLIAMTDDYDKAQDFCNKFKQQMDEKRT